MRRHRTTARGTVASLILAGLVAAALTTQAASGHEQNPAAAEHGKKKGVPRLVFPLVAKTDLWDNYGDPRGNGRHAGIDMENPWRAPVVAVEDGRVEYSRSVLGGCMLYLYGASGTMYLYIHLNNDLTAKNDDRGGCRRGVSYAIPDGAKVSAGEQVAWNGDSGDAAGNPHLHFEVHPNGGADVNPFRHLKRALRPLFAAKPDSPFSLGLRGHLLAAGEGAVEIEVEQVRRYPGGRWLRVEPRRVELSLPPEATAAPAISAAASEPRKALKGRPPVSAYTAKAKTTTEAILGAPGALQLSRISSPSP